jgi:multidrug efflux pump subunit AcrA (membrane-fusion protein)
VVAGALLGVAYLHRIGPFRPAPAPPPAEVAAPRKLMARGEVRPIGQARVGTLSGGVVHTLSVAVGDRVGEQQELARIKAGDATEVLTAPWSGTVIGLPVRLGDTVTAGALVAVVADLSVLQVETTDVDEYLIAELSRGQPATVSVEALNRRELRGYVRSVALYVEKNEDGDDHYPVVVDLAGSTAALRPGMSVRVTFAPDEAAP